MPEIHSTAVIDPRAQLADDVSVGAFSIIRAGVSVGAGTVIREHCHLHGNTAIGSQCQIGPAAFVGLPPQHTKFDGQDTWLRIGDHVIIREMASIHRSIRQGEENATTVGSHCFLMAGSHVGHDSQVGDHVILANAALLGGHCHVGDRAFIGGGATIHQFCRVGRLSIVAGNEAVSHDIPPFSAVRYGGLKGYNAIGCKRAGMPSASLHAIRTAFRCLHANRTIPRAVAEISDRVPLLPEIQELLQFIRSAHRGIVPSVRFHRRSVEATTSESAFHDSDN